MQVSLSVSHLASLLKDANELGAITLATELGLITPLVNKAKAIKMCGGKANYDQFVLQKLINPVKDGNDSAQYRVSRLEIETAVRSNNRAGYLTVQERLNKKKL